MKTTITIYTVTAKVYENGKLAEGYTEAQSYLERKQAIEFVMKNGIEIAQDYENGSYEIIDLLGRHSGVIGGTYSLKVYDGGYLMVEYVISEGILF